MDQQPQPTTYEAPLGPDDKIIYLLVREAYLRGKPCFTLVRQFKTLNGAWKFALRNRQSVWLFTGVDVEHMRNNRQLFGGDREEYAYSPDLGWHKALPPIMPYYRSLTNPKAFED